MSIAILWAHKIIDGGKTYAQVPNGLKTKVAEVLTSYGRTDLIV